MASVFIPDGFTVKSTIQFADGEVKVEFRPPVADELNRVLTDKVDGSVFLASKIVSWSGFDLESSPVTTENVKRLHSGIWQLLMDLLFKFPTETEIKNC